MNKNTIPVPNPDFDDVKNRLKLYMQSRGDLKDYDFGGSTLSIVLDTMSYNTHLNAFYLNMVANESNLHTAQRRNSVINAARDLGYVPQSAKASSALLYVEATPENTQSPEPYITIPAGFTFTASSTASSYLFSVLSPHIVPYNHQVKKYIVDNVQIHEGRLLVHDYTVVANDADVYGLPDLVNEKTVALEGVSIPNLDVDTNIMQVYVTDDDNENTEFKRYDGSLGLTEESKIYFVSEDEYGRTTVSFGSGILGYKLRAGAQIKIMYLVTSGSSANGVATFNAGSEIPGVKITRIMPHAPAAGGAFAENSESIKYNAQLGFESQGKAVVTGDYEYLVRQAYPNAQKVITVGGQDMTPPQFGKVFVSIQPRSGVIITERDKADIKKYITGKNVTTIDVVITEPDYTYIDLDVNLSYIQDGFINAGAIKATVLETIEDYAEQKLQTFDRDLDYSRLLSIIDGASPNIRSNLTTVKLVKRFKISDRVQREYSLDFGNAIHSGTLTSSTFKYGAYENCFFNGIGDKLAIMRTDIDGRKVVVLSDAGLIDAKTGIIRLRPLTLTPDAIYFDNYYNTSYIKVIAQPVSNNVKSVNNQILNIGDITINYNVNEHLRK